VPTEVQTCAPCAPVGHAHAALAPETHVAASLPLLPQAPRNAKGRHATTTWNLPTMRGMIDPFGLFRNLNDNLG
jgi:hypothetical protein